MSSIASQIEKPQNGVAGLKYWKSDLMAGLMVSLTSLPLSLGIAVASGAPAIAGLTSAIIAGMIFPFLGGAYLTISGPAAGLAPALLAAMVALGHGDRVAGYPLLLAVICMVGIIQVGLSLAGAARLSAMLPVAVVEGMLASIGLLIVVKELGHFLGTEFHSKGFFPILEEFPVAVRSLDPTVFGIGMICLVLMFVLHINGIRKLLPVPPPLVVVVIGMILGQVLKIDSERLIQMPDNILKHGITLPDFRGLINDQSLIWAAVSSVLILVLIDGVESLATIKAIDKIDPYKRRSDPDRTLLAMGVSNLASSLAGGLTIIPGGVKSKLCINSGGKTLWANLYNAVFLVIFLFVAKDAIKLIPYSALAAILIYTGYKMFEFRIWKHMAQVGVEQLFVFAFTIAVTLKEDLLIGIIAGMVLKFLINLFYVSRDSWSRAGRSLGFGETIKYALGNATQLFRNPVVDRGMEQDTYHLQFDRPLVCFNSAALLGELDRVPSEAKNVILFFRGGVAMIDHTTCDMLLHFAEEFEQSGRGHVEIQGLDRMKTRSKSPAALRVANRKLAPTKLVAEGELAAVEFPSTFPPTGDTLADVQSVD